MANPYPLYVYWEGTPKPYYEMCIDTIRRHNPDVVVIDRAAAEEIVGPCPDAVASAYVTHRVDWIRKRLVYETGGMYVDADFICMRPLDSVRRLAADFEYVGFKEWHGGGAWMDNFFAGRRHSPILRDAADYALDQLERHGLDVPWLACSADALTYAIDRHRWDMILQIPTHLVSPVSVMEPWWFTAEEPSDLRSFNVFGFMTSYHGIGGWASGRSKDELRESPSRVGQLFELAITR